METEILAIGKCTKLPVQTVVMNVKFRLNQRKVDLFIAGNVTKSIRDFRINILGFLAQIFLFSLFFNYYYIFH